MNTENLDTLRTSSNSFAQSLVSQYDRKGSLSEKQWHWVNKLTAEAAAPVVVPNVIGGFSRIVEIFENAAVNLQYPKLTIEGDITLRIKLLGSRSRNHGDLALTDDVSYPNNKYYGRITGRDGELILGRDGNAVKDTLVSILTSMSADISGFIGLHGRKTGNCCFCRLPLTDGRSILAGYGPTCAGNYGLPWGENK